MKVLRFFKHLSPVLLFAFAGIFMMNSCKQSSPEHDALVAVEASKMNVLYKDVKNPLKVAASGSLPSKIDVTIDNGRIEGDAGNYVVIPENTGKAVISVQQNGKMLNEHTFRVESMRDPQVILKGSLEKANTKLNRAELINAGGIEVYWPDNDFDKRGEVESFTVEIKTGNETWKSHSESAKFTKEQLSKIESIKGEATLLIKNIIISHTNDEGRAKRPVSGIYFEIV